MPNINIVAHNDCTGCGACYNKCPKEAITMEYDDEGFQYPIVNDRCIDCGLCVHVCPVINPLSHHPVPPAYATWASDEIRLQSSSGGMFTLLAQDIIRKNGAVCGARYSEDFQTVFHDWATSNDQLAPFRGSKYVQSETRLVYRQAKEYLCQGKPVLFTGCPCQIAGLYRYLGNDHPLLYTVDLVCHGSNSVKAYRSFLDEFSGGKSIEKIDFRDKKYFTWSTPTVVYLKNGDIKKAPWDKGTWYQGFLEGVICRENCSVCPYACAERVADITLADCWQVHRIDPKYDDRKGTSLVLVNSVKGKELFKRIKHSMKLCEEISLNSIRKYNGQLNSPSPRHRSRSFFFNHLDKLGYHKSLWYGRGMRFDVGIVGWWFSSNYGSTLTYYALGKILAAMKKQILLIPVPKLDGTGWDSDSAHSINFLKKHFYIGKNYQCDMMYKYNGYCDSFMIGSDQVWAASYIQAVGYTFFLDFVDPQKKKIAFSASLGKDSFNGDGNQKATASDYLQRFDAISVREQSGIAVCKSSFDVDADHIIDPVFFCDRKDYDEIVNTVKVKTPKRYLLCYILDPSADKEKAAVAIAKREKLEILVMLGMREYDSAKKVWSTGTVLHKVSSEEFLYYIKNCSFLFTDSHHGTCFGIIYQRPYIAMVNETRGRTRFESVADTFGLHQYVVESSSQIVTNDNAFSPIDYSKVDAIIEQQKQKGFAWLNDAFAAPTLPAYETVNTIAAREHRDYRAIKNLIGDLYDKSKEHAKNIEALQKTDQSLDAIVHEFGARLLSCEERLRQAERSMSRLGVRIRKPPIQIGLGLRNTARRVWLKLLHKINR